MVECHLSFFVLSVGIVEDGGMRWDLPQQRWKIVVCFGSLEVALCNHACVDWDICLRLRREFGLSWQREL